MPNQKPKILIATGGTGGHIYPALALAEQLKAEGIEPLFAGGNLSSNPYFPAASAPYRQIRSGSNLRQWLQIIKGVYDSAKIIKESQIDLIVAFGSYPTFPLLLAGVLKKVPLVLFAADSVPGRVIRWFSPFAAFTAVHFPEAQKHLSGSTYPVAMPLRSGFNKGAASKEEALGYFGLDGKKPVGLVVGGSKGALFLNKNLPEAVEKMKTPVDVIHITGTPETVASVEADYRQRKVHAVVKPFEPRMDLAWTAASFACSRSGAGSIAEALEFEVPSLLVPYPFAMDGHQDKNADFFVALGRGVKLQEKQATSTKLAHELDTLTNFTGSKERTRQTLKELILSQHLWKRKK